MNRSRLYSSLTHRTANRPLAECVGVVRRNVCLIASLFARGSFAALSGNISASRASGFEEGLRPDDILLFLVRSLLLLGGLSLVGPVGVRLMGIFCSSVSMLYSLLSVRLVSS